MDTLENEKGESVMGKYSTETEDLMIITLLILFKFCLRQNKLSEVELSILNVLQLFFHICSKCRNKKCVFHNDSSIEYFDISTSKYLSEAVW